MKRIGLNLVFLTPGLAGARTYCERLLRGLAGIESANAAHAYEYLVYVRQGLELPPLPPNFRIISAPVASASVLGRTAWEYLALPRRARADAVDLVHGLSGLSPAVKGKPLVLTIHDLIYRSFPGSVPLGHRLFMRAMHGRLARRAERIIAPSQHTARDIVHHLGVDESRIRLVPYGPGHDFTAITEQARIDEVLQRHRIHRPYLLSVARGYPHKNLAGLLRALPLLDDKEVQLVLVGERHLSGSVLDRLARDLGVHDRLVFTGFIANEEVNCLYSGTAAFAFPSLAEGLGLPVIEAMACGAPVVASHASAIPEAVGEAGLLVDARRPEALADTLQCVLHDASLQAKLRQLGLARARTFTWERCAVRTLDVYREVL